MELLLLGLLPLVIFGVFGGSDGGSGSDDDVDVDEPTGTITRDGNAGSDIAGGAGEDLIFGAGGADDLSGGAATDVLVGETGDDTLSGEDGEDVLLGGAGDDELFGGAALDVLAGGAGRDVLAGRQGGDLLFGSSGSDTLLGDEGGDLLIGLEPSQDLSPEEAFDVDLAELDAGLRDAFGSALRDTDVTRVAQAALSGSASEEGDDSLDGGDGADSLIGDQGDFMTGGEGTDSFAVLAGTDEEVPLVSDFDPATETLAILVNGPANGTVSLRNDAFDDGVQVLLDGRVVAYLEGVLQAQVRAGSITVESLT